MHKKTSQNIILKKNNFRLSTIMLIPGWSHPSQKERRLITFPLRSCLRRPKAGVSNWWLMYLCMSAALLLKPRELIGQIPCRKVPAPSITSHPHILRFDWSLRGPATRSLSQRTSNSDPVTTNVFIGRNSLLYLLLVLLRAGGALICIPCDRGPLKVHQLWQSWGFGSVPDMITGVWD